MTIVLAGLGFLLSACDSSPPGTTRVIDGSGGSVSASGARVDVPAGATSSSLEVGLRLVDASDVPALPTGLVAAGPAVIVTPHGAAFEAPVTITVPLTSAADQVLRLDDESDTTWDPVDAEIGSTAATLQTSRFSVYMSAAAGSSMCANACDLTNDGLSCIGCVGECAGGEPSGGYRCECVSGTWACCEGPDCTGPEADAGTGVDSGMSMCASPCTGPEFAGTSCVGCVGTPGCLGGGSGGDYVCECDPSTESWACCYTPGCSPLGDVDAGPPPSCPTPCGPESEGLSCAGCSGDMCGGVGSEGSYDCTCDAGTERWVCT